MKRIRNFSILRLAFVLYASGLVAGLVPARPAEIPEPTVDLSIYGRVVQVGWVVKDLDSVVSYWENLGLKNIRRTGPLEFPDTSVRGKKTPLTLKMAFTEIGDVQIEWIEPVKGQSVYDEFLESHGDGIHHLTFALKNPEQLEEQIAYFKSRGVEVVQHGSWEGTKGKGRFAYLDTAGRGGGITIELVHNPDAPPPGTTRNHGHEPPFDRITQYAIVVRDIKKVDEFYRSLGFGGMQIDHNISVNRIYRGKPGKFEMYLGWWRFGNVPFEWIGPLAGPSVYDEFLAERGEGFHHLAFNVKDMDGAIRQLEARGAPVNQSGGWDTPTSKGRFAYLETEKHGGVSIELLWNQPMDR